MFVRDALPALNAQLVRKTLLSALLGLMGGGSVVLAQQAANPPAAPVVTAAPAVAAAPVQDASAPAAGSAAAEVTPAAAAIPQADVKPDATDVKPGATAGSTPVATPVSVAVGADGKPLAPTAVSKKAKAAKKKKEKLPKMTPVNIVQGTLTVDGWTGKARLNYDIADLKFIYLWAPGVGTVVVSNGFFPLAKDELGAFSGNTLTVDANGHTIQLYSEKRLLNNKKPAPAFVYVDTSYQLPSAFPAMGFGTTVQPPYAWPGAKNVQLAKGGVVVPPPLPKDLRPALVSPLCVPAGSKAAGTPCQAAPLKPATPAATTTTAATSTPAGQTK